MDKIPELPPNRKNYPKESEPSALKKSALLGSIEEPAVTKKIPWKTIIMGLIVVAFFVYKFMPKIPDVAKTEKPALSQGELPPVKIVSSDTQKLARLEMRLGELEAQNENFQGAMDEATRKADIQEQNIRHLKRTLNDRDAKIALLGNKLGKVVSLHMDNQLNLGELAERIKRGEKTFSFEVVKRRKHREVEWENTLE